MAKSELQKISVKTLPNGYELKANGHEYMYFNIMDLLAGFMVHVGLQETDFMEKGNILTMLFQTMIGQEWEKNIAAMRNRIKDMEEKVTKTLSHLEQTAATGDRLEPKIEDLNEQVKKLQNSIEKQKTDNNRALMDVRESSQTAIKTAKEFHMETKALKGVVEKVKKAAEDVKAMKQMAEEHLKTVELYERRLENILPDDKKKKPSSKERYAKKEIVPSKSDEKPDGETSGTTAKKTTKKSVGGRNKAADAAVQEEAEKQREEELERQLQEHWKNDPNIK